MPAGIHINQTLKDEPIKYSSPLIISSCHPVRTRVVQIQLPQILSRRDFF